MTAGMLAPERLSQILAAMGKTSVGVIGDFCLDVYWMLDPGASEVSVETGKMTRPVRQQRYSLGGAGNVVANLCAIGVGQVHALGAVGDDPFGERLLHLLRTARVEASGMITVAAGDAWQTLAYCKPYVGEVEESRIDIGNFNGLPDSAAEQLLGNLERILPRLDAVVINEQVRTGIHTPFLQERLRTLIERYPRTVFIFDGRHLPNGYPGAWLKVNAAEAVGLCGVRKGPGEAVSREDVERAARELYRQRGRPVVVTRGERGCIFCDDLGVQSVPGLQVIGAVDPVGAGDSLLAGLAAATAAGASCAEAVQIGNAAARVTVAKLRQTGTASPAEILEVASDPQCIFHPELADDPRQAELLPGTLIEVIEAPPPNLGLRYAVFDHDGTVSTLRQGWEEVMEPMMVEAVMGERYRSADAALYRRIVTQVRQYIEQTTGSQTLVQMQGLVQMVREAGLVPEECRCDLHGYKAVYNEALMLRVDERLRRLQAGELAVEDFTVKNAVRFVETLNRLGIVCYLASGTDQDDVRKEARELGYAGLFAGGIYGAVGDIARDAKREVLGRILADIGDIRGRLVTFGDGPVEMRETRAHGGLPVGVASDEVRRFGLNPAKRARLIRAGAALVVPDFSQAEALLAVLGLHPR
jgi:sugar/nucleoside kinase (ribokinase family)